MKRRNAILVFLLCCLEGAAKSSTTSKATVIANLPTTTSYVWKANPKLGGNAHKPVTCFSVECTAYVNAPVPQSGGGITQVTIELLMPDGSINIVGCFRRPESLGHSTIYAHPCRVPDFGEVVEAKFGGVFGQVTLTMSKPNKDDKTYSEMYFLIGVLEPTGPVRDSK